MGSYPPGSGLVSERVTRLGTSVLGPPMDPLPDLDQIRIPRFEFPWPAAVSPAAESVEREMIQWALAHRLIPDDRYRSRIARTRYGWLAARCYPQADRELLQAAAD